MSFFAHRFFTHKIVCTECRTGTYDEIFKIQTGMTILEYPESLKCIKHLNFQHLFLQEYKLLLRQAEFNMIK